MEIIVSLSFHLLSVHFLQIDFIHAFQTDFNIKFRSILHCLFIMIYKTKMFFHNINAQSPTTNHNIIILNKWTKNYMQNCVPYFSRYKMKKEMFLRTLHVISERKDGINVCLKIYDNIIDNLWEIHFFHGFIVRYIHVRTFIE